MKIEELKVGERVAILQAQRREYRVILEQLRNNMEMATFLKDAERIEALRKDADKVVQAIEFFDKKIAELSAPAREENK